MRAILPWSGLRLLGAGALLAALCACGGGNSSSSEPAAAFASGSSSKSSSAVSQASGTAAVGGVIQGLNGSSAVVVLVDQASLVLSAQVDSQGKFEFTGLPYGLYVVKAEAKGYQVSPPQTVQLSQLPASTGTPNRAELMFSASLGNAELFSFKWDNLTGGVESSNHVNIAPAIKFLDIPVDAPASGAAAALLSTFNIVLSDKGVKWNQEYATRVLAALNTLPTADWNTMLIPHAPRGFRISRWELTERHLANDISIKRNAAGDTVLLSIAAFVYAAPRTVSFDGVVGKLFSKRLHHAMVRFATQDGTDAKAVDAVLSQRFGITARGINIGSVTSSSTQESALSFAEFRPSEFVELINSMEEMPERFFKVNGLTMMLRRAYGQLHPADKNIIARAVPSAGYIEFTDQAFQASATYTPAHVIIHEKTHFLWANVFTAQQKNDWTTLGGWYRDPTNLLKWKTSQGTGFVSAQAHETSPDEDMAESLATYIVNPNLLQSRALAKYNFIRDRIAGGDRYLSLIRSDLTFEVFNLAPDYILPGDVKRLELSVSGAPNTDKVAHVSMELFGETSPVAGAKECMLGFHSRLAPGKVIAIWASPVGIDGSFNRVSNGTRLRGQRGIARHVEGGYWNLSRGQCVDYAGNWRYYSANELGNASIFINNTVEKVGPPRYEAGSMTLAVTPSVTTDGHLEHHVKVRWKMQAHPYAIPDFHVWLNLAGSPDNAVMTTATYDSATRTVSATFAVPDYVPSGRYSMTGFYVRDSAENDYFQQFPDPVTQEAAPWVDLVNKYPDGGKPPELDLNRMTVSATPTQPAAPNGETVVKLEFYARDDGSGLNNMHIGLLSPQGNVSWFTFHTEPANAGGLAENWIYGPRYYQGDPTAWRRYEATMTLPVDSVPGQWGVQGIMLMDAAGFLHHDQFVETIHFVVSGK